MVKTSQRPLSSATQCPKNLEITNHVESEIYFFRMALSSFTKSLPVEQRGKFWSDYMSAIQGRLISIQTIFIFDIKGNLGSSELAYTSAQLQWWRTHCPGDVNLFDFIYGSLPTFPPSYKPLHTSIYGPGISTNTRYRI